MSVIRFGKIVDCLHFIFILTCARDTLTRPSASRGAPVRCRPALVTSEQGRRREKDAGRSDAVAKPQPLLLSCSCFWDNPAGGENNRELWT